MKYLLWIALVVLFVSPLQTQEIQETVSVELVDLYFTATDDKGRFITDLKLEEIVVREDGVPQKVQRFGAFAGERNEIPILLALVIDNSASMDQNIEETRKLDLARDAGLALLQELGPLDRVMLIRFSDIVTTIDLTSQKETIAASLQNMQPRWWHTALFDAVASSLTTLNAHSGRKILLLCSDGQDNMSKAKLEDVLDAASKIPELTIIVLGAVNTQPAIGMRGKVQSMPAIPMFQGKEILQSIADRTGGYAFFPKNLKDANKMMDLIRSFVQSQYYLAYHSTNQNLDGKFRKIEIVCKRKGVHLNYRRGYYAQ